MTTPARKAPPPILWWIIWGAIVAAATMIYLLPHAAPRRAPSDSLRYVPIIPLAIAVMIRWLILPRFTGARAFPIFVIGLALAESCVTLGVFLVPALRLEYFALGLFGLAQFAPIFGWVEPR